MTDEEIILRIVLLYNDLLIHRYRGPPSLQGKALNKTKPLVLFVTKLTAKSQFVFQILICRTVLHGDSVMRKGGFACKFAGRNPRNAFLTQLRSNLLNPNLFAFYTHNGTINKIFRKKMLTYQQTYAIICPQRHRQRGTYGKRKIQKICFTCRRYS